MPRGDGADSARGAARLPGLHRFGSGSDALLRLSASAARKDRHGPDRRRPQPVDLLDCAEHRGAACGRFGARMYLGIPDDGDGDAAHGSFFLLRLPCGGSRHVAAAYRQHHDRCGPRKSDRREHGTLLRLLPRCAHHHQSASEIQRQPRDVDRNHRRRGAVRVHLIALHQPDR